MTPWERASPSGSGRPTRRVSYCPGTFNNWSLTTTHLTQETNNGVGTGIWSLDSRDNGSSGSNQWGTIQILLQLAISGSRIRGRGWSHYSGSGGNSIVYDPNAFNWAGDSFTNRRKMTCSSMKCTSARFIPPSPSQFVAATNKLDYLKSLGVNAVEVMPIAEFRHGSSWGYNPAQLFAVENIGYGGPDGLKTFVKACHARGLAVFLDVVHNHYGPGDLEMWNFDGYAGRQRAQGRRHLFLPEQHQSANHALRRIRGRISAATRWATSSRTTSPCG